MTKIDMGQNRLKELLRQREMSIYRLAKGTGLTYQTLHALVKADEISGKTTYDTLKRIAIFLGVKIDDLEQA